jgi:hypothetical protein
MVKIRTKEKLLFKIEKILEKKRSVASKKIDAWRKRNEKILKNWDGVKIIRLFRAQK